MKYFLLLLIIPISLFGNCDENRIKNIKNNLYNMNAKIKELGLDFVVEENNQTLLNCLPFKNIENIIFQNLEKDFSKQFIRESKSLIILNKYGDSIGQKNFDKLLDIFVKLKKNESYFKEHYLLETMSYMPELLKANFAEFLKIYENSFDDGTLNNHINLMNLLEKIKIPVDNNLIKNNLFQKILESREPVKFLEKNVTFLNNQKDYLINSLNQGSDYFKLAYNLNIIKLLQRVDNLTQKDIENIKISVEELRNTNFGSIGEIKVKKELHLQTLKLISIYSNKKNINIEDYIEDIFIYIIKKPNTTPNKYKIIMN